MRLISFTLLSILSIAECKTGVIPIWPLYKGGVYPIASIHAPKGSATGILDTLDDFNMHTYYFMIENIEARDEAIGLEMTSNSSSVKMVGSLIEMSSITSKETNAYGIKSKNLDLTLAPLDLLLVKVDTAITLESLSAKKDAYGIFSNNLSITGKGRVYMQSITSETGVATGIKSNRVILQKPKLEFESISGDSAVGIDAYSLEADQANISISSITATSHAYGIRSQSNLMMNNLSLKINSITSKQGSAIGVELNGSTGMQDNYYASSRGSSTLEFKEVSGVNALGIKANGDSNLRDERIFLKFGGISASSGNAVGYYSIGGDLKVNKSVLDFGEISSASSEAYGFVADKFSFVLNLNSSTLSMSLRGKNGSAFEGFNGAKIDVSMSDSVMNIDGNGGKIEKLDVRGKNYIDLSGHSHHSFKDRTSSRSLTIHSLSGDVTIPSNKILTFGLYYSADKGIADYVLIEENDMSHWAYPFNINIDIYSDLSSQITTKSQPYALLLKSNNTIIVNGITSSSMVGTSVLNEGIESVITLIHRYDDGVGEAYYYLDTREKQQRSFNANAFNPILHAVDANLGSYFLSTHTLNKRMRGLKSGRDDSGLWGRVSFGEVDGLFADMRSVHIQIGGDYQKEKNGRNYFVGIIGGYNPTLSNDEWVSNLNHYEMGVYGGVYTQSGWFYYSQLKADYFQAQLATSQYMEKTKLSQWGMSLSNELGFRLSFGEGRGFFLEPKAKVSVGALMPIKYQQNILNSSRTLSGNVQALFALDSQLGGRIGYTFFGGSDIYVGAYYSYKGLYGGALKVEGVGSTGEKLSGKYATNRFNSLHSVLFDFGSNIEIGINSKLCFDVDFGFGDLYHTVYRVNASYRFNF